MTKEEMRGLVGRAMGGRLLSVEFGRSRGMKTTVEVIGPKEAEKYLERNEGNRPLRRQTVNRYAEMMRRGQWPLTHEAIAFDTNGELKNGQHRLAAVVQSGCTVQFTVTRGIEPATFAVIDSGVGRSTADRLFQVGTPQPGIVAPALKMIHLYRTVPDLRWAGGQSRGSTALVTNQDVLGLAAQYDDELLTEGCSIARVAGSPDVRLVRSSTLACFLLLKDSGASDTTIQAFFGGVITGEGLVRDDPRLTLRRWGVNSKAVPLKSQRCLVAELKAWNAFASNQPLRLIKWLPNEPMPQIVTGVSDKVAVAR